MREEFDSFGPILVPINKYWGAQTQRSKENFNIATDTDQMPMPVIKALSIMKKCAAKVNVNYGFD